MKKIISFVLLLSLLSVSLCSCFSKMIILPSKNEIGETKTFTKDKITLTLTDKFEEKDSELGFYAYYSSSFCGVTVTKEDFTLEEGLAEKALLDYAKGVMDNNGHSGEPFEKDGLIYYKYVRQDTGTCGYAYCYKGSNEFYIVQFLISSANESKLSDQIFFWAKSVKVS